MAAETEHDAGQQTEHWYGHVSAFIVALVLTITCFTGSLSGTARPAPVTPAPISVAATLTAYTGPQATHTAHLAHLAHLARAGTQRPAHAVLAAYRASPGNAALNWAERYALWHPYSWGGAGPWGYDCSGLVMAAYGHGAGIWLPHSTYAMLGSWHLIRTYSPQRGDLAFYGSGHVEMVTIWWHTTFGAQHSGTLVGWHVWNSYWAPTAYYRVR